MTDSETMRTVELIEKLPRSDTWMCYILLGYGCIYIGQTGAGEKRFHSTLQERPWAISIRWIDVRKLGIHDKYERENLEAQLIFSIFKSCDELGNKFHVTNKKFTRSLGRFSKGKNIINGDEIIKVFMNIIRSHEDSRGCYFIDKANSQDNMIDEEAQRLSHKRISRITSGYNGLNPKSFTYFEIILPNNAN